ncbi:MAG: phosphoribosylformylglycinamidine synthase subunit PurQ [Tenuifilaceae bacterium]|jgi:phosphoribosylformylglycinamidine synthase|nr:phosphoribosylformylglycinamidine synthase subunit PurQ [Bacteroidales bacterium]MDI9517603.1 phosphoribosylformylglycinamidine synthase subunit PurQ [Bacteroidota bacterium]NLH56630.1 phosphoribosylformylglycinamidine synthase subunit PurQ [Rikenellaceae bacterium]OQC64435.1 MAG: Phosphoribosylformylglycinamidine synthase 1 [Bacteroidetes bacterium ADurb.Bin008]HNV80939.1 phosphoribosylformylglycinamidine synthase subunit PurQ [Tenuifilaceae bacterium]
MKIGVVIFPGTSGDRDLIHVFRNVLEQEVVELWHKDTDLQNADIIVIPGGFAYGNYLRPGALAKFSPIMESIVAFAKSGGFVLGISNGFQILCESGLLPGTLLENESMQFVCKNICILPHGTTTALTASLDKNRPLKIPIAHGQGRYYADKEELARMRINGQILFRYCSEDGLISEVVNPNGSMENIAGICNEDYNVFGMMPFPERAADDELGNTDGRLILESLIRFVKGTA